MVMLDPPSGLARSGRARSSDGCSEPSLVVNYSRKTQRGIYRPRRIDVMRFGYTRLAGSSVNECPAGRVLFCGARTARLVRRSARHGPGTPWRSQPAERAVPRRTAVTSWSYRQWLDREQVLSARARRSGKHVRCPAASHEVRLANRPCHWSGTVSHCSRRP